MEFLKFAIFAVSFKAILIQFTIFTGREGDAHILSKFRKKYDLIFKFNYLAESNNFFKTFLAWFM